MPQKVLNLKHEVKGLKVEYRAEQDRAGNLSLTERNRGSSDGGVSE
jgi:hypothetical protein